MNKKITRILTWFLTLGLLLGDFATPLTAFAADNAQTEEISTEDPTEGEMLAFYVDLAKRKIAIGEEVMPVITFYPEDCGKTFKDLTIRSDNDNVILLEKEDGYSISGNKVGKSQVTIEAAEIESYIDLEIEVYDPDYIPISAENITLSPETMELTVGESRDLTIDIQPENAETKDLLFAISDPEVIRISETGSVTALKEGAAEIVAKIGEVSSNTVSVIVSEVVTIPVESVTLSEKNLTLSVNETKQLSATVAPEDATVKDIHFASSNEEIVSVDETGLVTALKEGKATVSVVTVSGNLSDECEVTVTPSENTAEPDPKPAPDPEPKTGKDSFDDLEDATESKDLYLVKGQKLRLEGCSVTSADTKIMTVSKAKGGYVTLTAKKVGKTSITVTNKDGVSLTHTVYIETLRFEQKSYSLPTARVIKPVVHLGDHTEHYSVAFYTSNPNIVRYENGALYCANPGAVTLTAVVNGKKFTCKIIVKDPTAPKEIETQRINLNPYQTATLKFKDGFKAKNATWEITNTDYNDTPVDYDIVRMKDNKITGVAPGYATMIGTAADGTIKEVIVEVKTPLVKTIYLNVGKTKNAKFQYLNNKSAEVSWTSEDTTIATVEKGKIKGLRPGSTRVIATYGNFKYYTVVKVEEIRLITDEQLKKAGKNLAIDLTAGSVYQLKMENVYQTVVFVSDKPEVARVNKQGQIIASSAGKAKLTAKINGVTVKITVTVGGRNAVK